MVDNGYGVFVDNSKGAIGSKHSITTGSINAPTAVSSLSVGPYPFDVDLTVNGSITGNDGIYASLQKDSTYNYVVNGDIIASHEGLHLSAERNSEGHYTFYGDINSEKTGARIVLYNDNVTAVAIGGSVYAPYGVVYSANPAFTNSGTNAIVSAKDIISDNVGLIFSGMSKVKHLVVADTIRGNEVAVGTSYSSASNKECSGDACPTLYVWKIEKNTRGNLAEAVSLNQQDTEIYDVSGTADTDFELNHIFYLLKVVNPASGATLRLTDANGNALKNYYGTDLGQQGDKILVKVNNDANHRVKAVYNGYENPQELTKDSNGDYFFNVAKGGGVYIWVDLEEVSPQPDDTPDNPPTAEQFNIKFVNYNGALLQESNVPKDVVPTYDNLTPVKESDGQCSYVFSGWVPEIAAATKDAVYLAKFDAVPIDQAEPVQEALKIVNENKASHIIGSGKDHKIQINRKNCEYPEVVIEGISIDHNNFKFDADTGIIRLLDGYLDRLSVGEHKAKISLNGESVETTFKIEKKAETSGGNSNNSSNTNKDKSTNNYNSPPTGIDGPAPQGHRLLSFTGQMTLMLVLGIASIEASKRYKRK